MNNEKFQLLESSLRENTTIECLDFDGCHLTGNQGGRLLEQFLKDYLTDFYGMVAAIQCKDQSEGSEN